MLAVIIGTIVFLFDIDVGVHAYLWILFACVFSVYGYLRAMCSHASVCACVCVCVCVCALAKLCRNVVNILLKRHKITKKTSDSG